MLEGAVLQSTKENLVQAADSEPTGNSITPSWVCKGFFSDIKIIFLSIRFF
jgi:hypothetical protein